jgi:hypothetical protein
MFAACNIRRLGRVCAGLVPLILQSDSGCLVPPRGKKSVDVSPVVILPHRLGGNEIREPGEILRDVAPHPGDDLVLLGTGKRRRGGECILSRNWKPGGLLAKRFDGAGSLGTGSHAHEQCGHFRCQALCQPNRLQGCGDALVVPIHCKSGRDRSDKLADIQVRLREQGEGDARADDAPGVLHKTTLHVVISRFTQLREGAAERTRPPAGVGKLKSLLKNTKSIMATDKHR